MVAEAGAVDPAAEVAGHVQVVAEAGLGRAAAVVDLGPAGELLGLAEAEVAA